MNTKKDDKHILDILIVEDNSFFRSIITSALNQHNCRYASTGDEAIRIFKRSPAAVTFLDINMPGTDGITTLTELLIIKQDAFIVMLSGQSDRNTIEDAMAKGAKGFLTKPIAKGKLEFYLDRYLTEKYESSKGQDHD